MKVMNPDHNTLACYAILTKLLQEICKLGFKYGMSRPDCDALAVSSSFPRAMVYPPAPPAVVASRGFANAHSTVEQAKL
jgi:hypothetical protein